MGHTSPCHKCNAPCLPKYILNKVADITKETKATTLKRHSCESCNGVWPCRVYKRLLAFSQLHVSTGSTQASLMLQADEERFIDDFEFEYDQGIREEGTDDEFD